MPTWLKVVLGISAAVLVVLAALVAGGVLWFRAHRGELLQAGTASLKAGQRFGVNQDQQGCLAEGFKRLPAVNGITEEIQNNLFIKGCLDVSKDSPGFCTGVPDSSEIMATVKWRGSVCAGHAALDPQRCQRFLQVWQDACHPRVRLK